MDEPTALLPPVSTQSLSDLLAQGPLELSQGLELMSVIAGQVAKLHANTRTHGLLSAEVIRVQTFENGPPVVIFNEVEATRDMSEGSDHYALGVLTFQVLVGRPPKLNETLAQAMPDAPTALDRLVSKLMSPNPNERMNAAGAARQLGDLASSVGQTSIRPASPIAALPNIKRGVPIGEQRTDAHAWVQRDEAKKPSRPSAPLAARDTDNPFGEDEATIAVPPRPTAPDPPTLAGPAMDDEPTQFEPVKRPAKRRGATTDRVDTPLPPPIMTPAEGAEITVGLPPETTKEEFEPSRSDLPGHTGEALIDPRMAPKRTRRKPQTVGQQLIATLSKQPPWVWAAAGVGLAFFVLLLIALAR